MKITIKMRITWKSLQFIFKVRKVNGKFYIIRFNNLWETPDLFFCLVIFYIWINSMKDDFNGRRPQQKMTSTEDDLNRRRPQ